MKKILFLLLFSLLLYADTLPLTFQEKELINTQSFNCISTGSWAPFNLWENNQFTGIGFDYWNLLRQRLNIKSECQHVSSWVEVLEKIKNKSADVTVATQSTKERLEYAVFSKPYAIYPIVIVTKNDIGFIHDLDILKDKKIAIGKDFTVDTILKEHYPHLNIVYVKSIEDALEKVEQGEVFASIDILPVLAYNINKEKFSNLKISGSTPYNFSVSFMFQKEYEMLLPIINKAIDSISKEEKNIINERWLKIHRSEKTFSTYSYVFFVLILFFAIRLFLLQKEVIKKNRKEKELKKLVNIDSLTNIFNRYMLDNTLDKEISLSERHKTPLSIIFFDIDGFKSINDTYGHKVGDSILKELSNVIRLTIRKSDIFCRWGGDEFLIVLINTEEENAKKLAKNIEIKIKKYKFKKDIPVHCTFGITSYKKGDIREDMIKRVDEIYYKEKNLKRKKEDKS